MILAVVSRGASAEAEAVKDLVAVRLLRVYRGRCGRMVDRRREGENGEEVVVAERVERGRWCRDRVMRDREGNVRNLFS